MPPVSYPHCLSMEDDQQDAFKASNVRGSTTVDDFFQQTAGIDVCEKVHASRGYLDQHKAADTHVIILDHNTSTYGAQARECWLR